jgi:predicted permease
VPALAWFYSLFYGALILGFSLRRFAGAAPRIMQATIILIETWIFIYSYWILNLQEAIRLLPIPLASLLLVVIPLVWGPFVCRALNLDAKASGSFILATAFSNIGNTGGMFLCYIFFGWHGLALAALYLLPYPFLIFTLGFSVAKHYASAGQLRWQEYITNIFSNPFSIIPLVAMLVGFALNFSGLKPPVSAAPVVDVLIKLDLALMCLAIGMTIQARHFFSPLKPVIAASLIKFLALPILAWILTVLFFGLTPNLQAKVILIQSAMPAAIYAVITANLYALDRNLVNALWLSTTLLLIPAAAVMFLIFAG